MKWLFITLLFSLPVFSSDISISIPRSQCTDLDVKDRMNGELRAQFSQPRNQDSIGWCYGFAAADLISAEIGEPVSAFHASALYNEKVEKSFLPRLGYKIRNLFRPDSFDNVYEGGFIKKAIQAVGINRKVCPEKDLPFDGDYSRSTQNLILQLETLKREAEESSVEASCQSIQSFLNSQFLTNLSATELHATLLSNNINLALTKIIDQHCGEKQLPVSSLKVITMGRPRLNVSSNQSQQATMDRITKSIGKYFETINSHLDSGKPIGVDYNVRHVTGSSGLHASVLVGRRWRNGRCEYKIRNSWGKSCASYDTKKITQCDRKEGAFWITDQKFYEMVSDITYIKP